MALIEGGYIIVARKMFEGELMDKPGLYLKLWLWMLDQANWRDQEKLKRGQFITSISEMQEAMSYMVGYRKKTPTVKQIRSAYEWFAKGTMIGTTKTTRGMIITILNFGKYQDPKSYERHDEGHNEKYTKGRVGAQDTEEREEEKKEKKEDSLRSSSCPDPAGPAPKVVGTLPLNDGSDFEVTAEFVEELAELYPAVDVLQEFRKMKGWVIGNPAKKKTRSGIKRFITNWLSREQDRGRPTSPQHQGESPNSTGAASAAWNGVLEAVRLGRDLTDPVAREVVRQLWGGLHGVGQLRPDSHKWARKDFIEAYRAQKEAA